MRNYSPTTAAYFADRNAFLGHVLVWISARNRSTGVVETIGFWTGADAQVFTIGGVTRTYQGAGVLLKMEPIRRQTGIKVRTQRLTFSQVAPATLQAIQVYDPRHAPIEVRRALFHPLNETLIDEPHIILQGFIDKATTSTPAKSEAGSVSIEVATHGRALTRTLSRYRSDATLRARASTDAFRQYASIADVETPWGKKSK